MNYLVSVWGDRIQAEEVYSALEKEGVPLESMSILGRGYKSADEFGLIDPIQQARQQVFLMAAWLIPFGFLAGTAFSSITHLETFAWAGTIGDRLISGLLGGIGGAMGSVFVGGSVGLVTGSGDAVPFRNRLNEGKYLVVIQGSEALIARTSRIIRPFQPEYIHGYVAS